MDDAYDHGGSLEEVRAGVVKRLRARRVEIEEAVFARVSDPAFGQVGEESPEYAAGLHTAVAAAVEFSFAGLEQREGSVRSIPPAALEQARRGARFGVSLDTVLRRYIAGQGLLANFIMEEAVRGGFISDEVSLHHHLMETQTPLLERLVASIIDTYTDEVRRVGRLAEQRRVELVQGLLADGQPDVASSAELDYDFDAWHLGVIARGDRVPDFVRSVKAALGCEYLTVRYGERTTWIWFGRRRKLTVAEFERMSAERPASVSLALGELRRGIVGWRLTHREAQAALLVGLRKQPGLTMCSDVLLEAAVLQHEVLATALAEIFLVPLDGLGYRGQTARDTLRAYFEAKRNVSSTASRLGVARNTVESRLREIEERLGRPLHTCSAQLEVALRLEALGGGTVSEGPRVSTVGWSEEGANSIFGGQLAQSAQSPRASLSTLVTHLSTRD